jgi:hypothetical protein
VAQAVSGAEDAAVGCGWFFRWSWNYLQEMSGAEDRVNNEPLLWGDYANLAGRPEIYR